VYIFIIIFAKILLKLVYLYRDEHVKHGSDCPFVKLNKQNEKEWTVFELFDLYKKYKIKEFVSIFTYVDFRFILINNIFVIFNFLIFNNI